MTPSTGTHAPARPSLATALLQAWRVWHEHDRLLPTGPSAAGPWAGRAELDQDRLRVLADLNVTGPEPD